VPKLWEPVLPLTGLLAGFEQHGAAEIDDEARVLGERNERVRPDESSCGIEPASKASKEATLPVVVSTTGW